ncbi:hypothetical protein ATCC90586_007311 [Pythium insidiosum]|nr:hypothetical protein ATCC90586_007311 [Pythium insidiosum]
MFGHKLITIAATVALAIGATTTTTDASFRGVEGIFCVSGQACVANTNGTCPEPQEGLEFGAYCGKVKTGVLGCKPYKSEAERKAGPPKLRKHKQPNGNCQAGWSPMSVEGVQGVFCVQGQACVADKDGACPGPQNGLPNGSHCGTVKTGVKGCKPGPAPPKHHKKSAAHKQAPKCGKDESPMSVEGTGVKGCKPGPAPPKHHKKSAEHKQAGKCPSGQSPMSVEGVEGVFCVEGQAEEVEYECDDDETEMSVEGVEGIFCVSGHACVANTNGTCPEPQEGLEFGAYCGKVKTGVLGCKPYKSEAERKAGPPKARKH